MAFEVPLDTLPADFDRILPGDYHVQFSACEEDGGDAGEMICEFEILAGSTPGQEGLIHREYFSKTPKTYSRILKFLIGLGKATQASLKEMKAAGKSPLLDFESWVGGQLCVRLTEEEYQGKKRTKINYDFFAITDPYVSSWPKNAAMLAKAGIVLSAPPPAAPTGGLLAGI